MAAGSRSTAEVFISYARATSSQAARDLRDALGAIAFLDESEIVTGQDFVDRIADSLLGCRVFVAIVDETYFQRWYCGKEWAIATALYLEAIQRRRLDTSGALDDALDGLSIGLGSKVLPGTLRRLPPRAQTMIWPNASSTAALADLVRSALQRTTKTLAERLGAAGILKSIRRDFASAAMIPPPGNLHAQPLHPKSIRVSLGETFVGRADDLWHLNRLLTPPSDEVGVSASVTGAIRGAGGYGKTCLAREYAHRFGPLYYKGGIFWLDADVASDDPLVVRERIESQHYEMLEALEGTKEAKIESLDALRSRKADISGMLANALHRVERERRILFIVDNVPEAPPRTLETWCPAPALVTLLLTSRASLALPGVESKELEVLDRESAVQLLTRDLSPNSFAENDAYRIAEAVGDLPLVLELLNAALRGGFATPSELRERLLYGSATVTPHLNELRTVLAQSIPDGVLRGVTEAFLLSHERLGPGPQRAARILAQLSPSSIPPEVVDAACREGGVAATRGVLQSSSILQREGHRTDSTPSWRMHRILADFLRTPPVAQPDDWVAALDVLGALLTKDRCNNHALRSRLAPLLPLLSIHVDRRPWGQHAPESLDSAGDRLIAIADAVDDLGEHSPEIEAKILAARAYVAALATRPRSRRSLDWAMTQNNLGVALQVLGVRSGEVSRLEEALGAYRLALEERTRARVPLDWATTQNNLGIVLRVLGQRSGEVARLEEAVGVYRLALEERTRERVPLDWAMTQNNLGVALQVLGERSGEVARLEEAVGVYRLALEERTRERVPLDWAMTQNNLGVALQVLGQRSGEVSRLEEAVGAFRQALEERTRARMPLEWATTQNNLGIALWVLGVRSGEASRLEEAVGAYRQALEERTRERVPFNWAMTQNNLGIVLRVLGERSGEVSHLKEAVQAFERALEELSPKSAPHFRAIALRNLERARESLRRLRGE